MIKEQDIIEAYIHLRKTNYNIPSEVLDFIKIASLEKLEKINREQIEMEKEMEAKNELNKEKEKSFKNTKNKEKKTKNHTIR
jgi:hypothetical protein